MPHSRRRLQLRDAVTAGIAAFSVAVRVLRHGCLSSLWVGETVKQTEYCISEGLLLLCAGADGR